MEKRSSTPIPVADTPEEDIVYPVPNSRPRESTIPEKSSEPSIPSTGKRHRGLESLERMKAQDKPRLSPYEEALQVMKEFEVRVQEREAAERKAAEERAEQEKLARETAAREQAECEALEAIRLKAERKAQERGERECRIRESRIIPASKKPSRGMDL
ncbi:MAG: hypothetical protein PHV59_03525 [Victivallales bacterium]|nr:hypothetical protein [Victivallales bacterium]